MEKKKDISLFSEDENYAEAKRLIEECRKNNGKKLDFSKLRLKKIPPEITQLQFLEELEINMDTTFQGPYTKLYNMPNNIGNLKKLKYL